MKDATDSSVQPMLWEEAPEHRATGARSRGAARQHRAAAETRPAVLVTHRSEVLTWVTVDLPERCKIWIQPVCFSTRPENVICQKRHQARHVRLGRSIDGELTSPDH